MNAKTLLASLAVAVALPAAALPVSAWAHHGWAGQEDAAMTLQGTITSSSYTAPHGKLEIIAADQTHWTITLAPPTRMSARGLKPEMLKPGEKVTIQGNRNLDHKIMELKAASITVGGKTTDLMA